MRLTFLAWQVLHTIRARSRSIQSERLGGTNPQLAVTAINFVTRRSDIEKVESMNGVISGKILVQTGS